MAGGSVGGKKRRTPKRILGARSGIIMCSHEHRFNSKAGAQHVPKRSRRKEAQKKIVLLKKIPVTRWANGLLCQSVSGTHPNPNPGMLWYRTLSPRSWSRPQRTLLDKLISNPINPGASQASVIAKLGLHPESVW